MPINRLNEVSKLVLVLYKVLLEAAQQMRLTGAQQIDQHLANE